MLNKKTLIQFIKFGVIGFTNTFLSYFLYLLFLNLFEKKGLFREIDYIVSSVIAFCISVVWSFYWNNRITFKMTNGEERHILGAFVKTVLCYSFTGLFLHNILLYIMVEWYNIPKTVVPLINLTVTVPLNFLLHKYWAFSQKKN